MSQDHNRKQSVVFFSDIVGYTRLMGKDEDHAFDLMKKNLEIHTEILGSYRGNIIKELGDGILATFETVPEALEASIEIHKRLQSIPDMQIRIGLHCGEIIFDHGDVFGDAVNLTARIQGIGVPSCILISEKAREQLPFKTDFNTQKLGMFRLKNVEHPVQLHAVTNPPCAIPKRSQILDNIHFQEKNPWKFWAVLSVSFILLTYLIYSILWNTSVWEKDKSVAILPFTNLSNNSEQEFFSEGLTADVITQVSKIGSIKVITKDAVEPFRGPDLPLDSIANTLGVSTILKGNIRWIGDKIRINVQLIDPSENKNLWAETYNREVSDIFEIQAEIASEIARVLNSNLSAAEKDQLNKAQTSSFDAYDLYLKGRELYSLYRKQTTLEAAELFKEAVRIDPEYALAYTGLANAYAQYLYFGEGDQWLDSSMEASAKALAIDPYLAEAFTAQGSAYYYKGQNEYAKISFEKALVLNPNLSTAMGNLATVYFISGDLAKSLKLQSKSATLNPTNHLPYQITGWIYRVLDQFNEAHNWIDQSIEIQKDPLSYEQKAFTYFEQNKIQEGIELANQVILVNNDTTSLGFVSAGTIHFFAGDFEKAAFYLEESLRKKPDYESDEYFISPVYLSYIYKTLGKTKEANVLLDKAISIRKETLEDFKEDFNLWLDLAQLEAVRGNINQSSAYLKEAFNRGFRDDFQLVNNPIFKNYLSHQPIRSLLSELQKKRMEMNQELQTSDLLRNK